MNSGRAKRGGVEQLRGSVQLAVHDLGVRAIGVGLMVACGGRGQKPPGCPHAVPSQRPLSRRQATAVRVSVGAAASLDIGADQAGELGGVCGVAGAEPGGEVEQPWSGDCFRPVDETASRAADVQRAAVELAVAQPEGFSLGAVGASARHGRQPPQQFLGRAGVDEATLAVQLVERGERLLGQARQGPLFEHGQRGHRRDGVNCAGDGCGLGDSCWTEGVAEVVRQHAQCMRP
ncbi:hypothetical protein [Micromonospora sp. LOL_024]|uniref:hypothetical protein n=1 Tax=Micromonospora sp. LOL_024 TaxID=3345412 RepID=UPI003A8B3544